MKLFFVSPNILFHILHIKNLCPTIKKKWAFWAKNIKKKSMMKIRHFAMSKTINKCKISLHTSKDRIKTSETKNRKQKILRNKSKWRKEIWKKVEKTRFCSCSKKISKMTSLLPVKPRHRHLSSIDLWKFHNKLIAERPKNHMGIKK